MSIVRSSSRLPGALLACHLFLLFNLHAAAAPSVVLLPDTVHLGQAGEPEYDVFAQPKQPPHKPPLVIPFTATANTDERTLFIRQDDVKENWQVQLNGRRLGNLFTMEAPLVHTLPVPPGTLRDGDNELHLISPNGIDDILVGPIVLQDAPSGKAVQESTLEIEVADRDSAEPLPCRITIIDHSGALAALIPVGDRPLALRPGVVYTPNGQARVGLRAGTYHVHATRGFEYGLATREIILKPRDEAKLSLRLGREVDTSGWVASDTHTHTFTFSRHGDATIEERAITLAGEGIELPIATDHNILTDYREAARRTGVASRFTPVIGDEVTTRQAHFNVFPVESGSRVPDFRIQDWPRLFQNIRETPGVEVVILNHPLNVHNAFQPFHPTNFNNVTGEIYQYLDPGFDALELMNSSAQQTDMMGVVRGWFALLNAGHRVTALGTSDGHDVSRYIIGQGRTYLRADDANPADIDVAAACRSLKSGRALVSMGLLADIKVDNRFQVGEMATTAGERVKVDVIVQGPSWTAVDRVQLFGNGVLLREERFEPVETPGIKKRVTWSLERPAHDVHLVALATGPGVTEPYWAIPRPYQRTSIHWTPRVMAATNPVWWDADGDGSFQSARQYAERLMETRGSSATSLLTALKDYDEAVAAQAAGLWDARSDAEDNAELEKHLGTASAAVQRGMERYFEAVARRK